MPSLLLADGTAFTGDPFGSAPQASQNEMGEGEVVFTTGMVGYPESLTDPSYRGQILVFTYPLIGNYGVPGEELNEWGFSRHFESEAVQVRGVVCAKVSGTYSHHAAVMGLDEWLKKHNVPGLTGVDTRALTKKLRELGVMLGAIRNQESGIRNQEIGDPNLRNLVAEVSCSGVITYEPDVSRTPFIGRSPRGEGWHPAPRTPTVVAFDCGMKRNILRSFLRRGVKVVRVPWDFDLSKADFAYDGVFISNGPGDPKMCTETIAQIAWCIRRGIPTFGICLGNQLMALAVGGDTYKLPYGHRGANQPCIETRIADRGSRCIITSQNHGFAVSDELPKGWSVWFRNANDGTVEGIRHESGKFFATQFHPEATPGPEDANYLFDEFLSVLQNHSPVAG